MTIPKTTTTCRRQSGRENENENDKDDDNENNSDNESDDDSGVLANLVLGLLSQFQVYNNSIKRNSPLPYLKGILK